MAEMVRGDEAFFLGQMHMQAIGGSYAAMLCSMRSQLACISAKRRRFYIALLPMFLGQRDTDEILDALERLPDDPMICLCGEHEELHGD